MPLHTSPGVQHCWSCRWLRVLLLLWGLQTASATYQLFISSEVLESLYRGTDSFDAIQGFEVNIVVDGKVNVAPDGSLGLVPVPQTPVSQTPVPQTPVSQTLVPQTPVSQTPLPETPDSGSGSGMEPLLVGDGENSTTSRRRRAADGLPPLPPSAEEITFTWSANSTVLYEITYLEESAGLFAQPVLSIPANGSIPSSTSDFSLTLPCGAASSGVGKMWLNLTTVDTNSTGGDSEVQVAFFLEKECEANVSTSVVPPSSLPSLSLLPTSMATSTNVVLSTATPNETIVPSVRVSPGDPLSPSIKPTLTLTSQSSPFAPMTSSSTVGESNGLLEPATVSGEVSIVTAVTTVPFSMDGVNSPFLMPYTSPPLKPSTASSGLFPPTTTSLLLSPSFHTTAPVSPSPSFQTTAPVSPSPSFQTPSFQTTAPVSPSPSFQTTVSPSPSFVSSTSPELQRTSVRSTPFVSSSSVPLPSPTPDQSSVPSLEPPIPSLSLTPTPILMGEPEDTSEGGDLLMILIVAVVPAVGVVVLCVCLLCCFLYCAGCSRKKAVKRFSDDPLDVVHTVRYDPDGEEERPVKKSETPLSLWMPLAWGTVSRLPQGIQGIIRQFNVDRRSLNLVQPTMRGEFGCVAKGQLCTDRRDAMGGSRGVVMKMIIGLKEAGMRDEVARFLDQATLMRGVEHPNILSVLRVSVEDNCIPLVVYPMTEHGNMFQFLTVCRTEPSEAPLNPMTIQWKVHFSLQLATAMKFLSDNAIIHPDLALRNCLLDTDSVLKVSDGALSQEAFPDCYCPVYGAIRPVRWAAMETLHEGLCTSRSNVWSFGVTVWEIMTLAETPYSDVGNKGVCAHLMMEERLPQPEECPEAIYFLMSTCWKTRAEQRPNFTSIYNSFRQFYSEHQTAPDVCNGTSPAPYISVTEHVTSTTFGKTAERQEVAIDREPSCDVSERGRSRGDYAYSSSRSHGQGTQGGGGGGGLMQRDSQNYLQPEKVSLTFSCLSSDYLGGGGAATSESEAEMDSEHPSRVATPPSRVATPPPLAQLEMPPLGGEFILAVPEHNPPTQATTSFSNYPSDDYLGIPSTFLTPQHIDSDVAAKQANTDLSPLLTSGGTYRVSNESMRDSSSYSSNPTASTKASSGDSTFTLLQRSPSPSPKSTEPTPVAITPTPTSHSVATPNAPNGISNYPVAQPNGVDSVRQSVSTYNPPNELGGGHPLAVERREGVVQDTAEGSLASTRAETSNGSVRGHDKGTDSAVTMTTGGNVVRHDSHLSAASRDSRTSNTSFGLGLSDLSSDFMAAFEKWDVKP